MVPNENNFIKKYIEFQNARQKELEQLRLAILDWASQFHHKLET